jgi:hypothetical protein
MDQELIATQTVYVKLGTWLPDSLQEGTSRIGLPLAEKQIRLSHSTRGNGRGVIGGTAVAITVFFENRRTLRQTARKI